MLIRGFDSLLLYFASLHATPTLKTSSKYKCSKIKTFPGKHIMNNHNLPALTGSYDTITYTRQAYGYRPRFINEDTWVSRDRHMNRCCTIQYMPVHSNYIAHVLCMQNPQANARPRPSQLQAQYRQGFPLDGFILLIGVMLYSSWRIKRDQQIMANTNDNTNEIYYSLLK